jgi:hypothetical protein
LAEIADGLACAVEARVERGQSPTEAAHAAVDEFGEPNQVVAAFARQMLTTTAHRTGMSLVLSGPIVGLVWASVWGARATSWSGKIDAVLSGVHGLPLLLLLTVPCAVLAAGAGRRLGRWLNVPTRWLYPAALAATGGCMAVDATMVGVVLARRELVQISATLLVAGVVVSLLRGSAAAVAMSRLVREHAASN